MRRISRKTQWYILSSFPTKRKVVTQQKVQVVIALSYFCGWCTTSVTSDGKFRNFMWKVIDKQNVDFNTFSRDLDIKRHCWRHDLYWWQNFFTVTCKNNRIFKLTILNINMAALELFESNKLSQKDIQFQDSDLLGMFSAPNCVTSKLK